MYVCSIQYGGASVYSYIVEKACVSPPVENACIFKVYIVIYAPTPFVH